MATTVSLKPNAVEISGSTSGTTTLQATAVAGTTTLTLPAATDTLVGKATTDTLTNKTLTTPSVSSPTISDGTANGVAYLNGSKVLTTGTALVFDGTNFSTTGTIKGSTTIGVGNATPSTSGAGITFPATQSASSNANTLDDYEEGTWTPSFDFGTAGNLTIVYSSQVGIYTKIGRTVHVEMTMATTTFTHTTASGNASISGLPFTIGGTDATTLSGACGGYVNATYPILGMQFFPTVTAIFLTRGGPSAGAAATFLDFPSSGNLYITFQATYIV